MKQQFCTFRIANRLFGVNIRDVKEIHMPVTFTPVFHAGEEVRGFVNIRGQVHLIIDLRVLLGFDKEEVTKYHRLILFKPHVGESFGILADGVGDVAEVQENEIETLNSQHDKIMESGSEEALELINGICKLRDSLLMILDAKILLEKVEKKK